MSKYDSDNIKNLQFPDSVRTKPGMYIGPTDASGVLTITREITDNSVDEAIAGRCSLCGVHLRQNGEIWAYDDGSGIPAGTTQVTNPADHSVSKVHTLRAVYGVLHTSGKFNDAAYQASRGCFSGETEVRLLNGKVKTMKWLYRRWKKDQTPIPIMTFDLKEQRLVPSVISHVQLTMRTKRLVEVVLDSGEIIRVTPDHPFYKNVGDGSIGRAEAQQLKAGDSLVSTYYKKDHDGYPIMTEQGRKVRVHRRVAECCFDEIRPGVDEVHHISKDIVNNEPSNLEVLAKVEHQREHSSHRSAVSRRKIINEQEDLRLANSRIFVEQNTQEEFKQDAWRAKAIKIAARAYLASGKVTKETFEKARVATDMKWSTAQKYISVPDLKAAAVAKVKYAESTLETRLTSERLLERLGSDLSNRPSPKEQSSNANWVKTVDTWREVLLSFDVPEDVTPKQFNRVNGAAVYGRYARLCRYTSLAALKRHVLFGEELSLHTDMSEEAQNARMIRAELQLRSKKSKRRMLALFISLCKKLQQAGVALNEENYSRKKPHTSPRWELGMALFQAEGDGSSLEEFVQDYNHTVAEVRHVTLDEAIPVYDITVDNEHTFFVEPGVLVKNTHGVGAKSTNALSTEFEVWTFNKGKWWHILFNKGRVKEDVAVVAKPPKNPASGKVPVKGTIVRFIPDKSIFSSTRMPRVELFEWARLSAYLTPGLRVVLTDEKDGDIKSKTFHFPGGVNQYLEDRLAALAKEAEFGIMEGPAFVAKTNALYDCAIRFTSYDGFGVAAYTNGLVNADGGNHMTSMLNAMKEALQPYVGKKQEFTLHELKDGLVGLINAKLSSPKFSSQTKDKLVDERALAPIKDALLTEFTDFFKKNRKLAQAIVDRAVKLRQLKSKFVASKQLLTKLKKISAKGLPAKGATAPKCKPEERETYLLEGDCFLPGTLIHTVDGDKPIEELTEPFVGVAFNPETGTFPHVLMSASFTRKVVTEVVDVEFEDGKVVTCTPEHEWLTVNRGYVAAQDLLPTDTLLAFDRGNQSVN